MLQNNDAAPDIEKLGRDEFVVNIEAREAQLVKNKKAVRLTLGGSIIHVNSIALRPMFLPGATWVLSF